MPTPVTAFTATALPGVHKVFKATDGAYYIGFADFATDQISIWKATDPTGTWTKEDSVAFQFTNTAWGDDEKVYTQTSMSPDGDSISVSVICKSTVANPQVSVYNVTAGTFQASVRLDSGDASRPYCFSLSEAANSVFVALYSRENSDQWTIYGHIRNTADNTLAASFNVYETNLNAVNPQVVWDSDRGLFQMVFLRQGTVNGFPNGSASHYITARVTTSGTLTTDTAVALPDSDYYYYVPGTNAIYFADPFNSNRQSMLHILTRESDTHRQLLHYRTTAIDGWDTTSSSEISGWPEMRGSGSEEIRDMCLAKIGNNIYCVFVNFSGSVYLAKRTGLTSWSTPAKIHDSTTAKFVSANSYNRGGADYLGITFFEGSNFRVLELNPELTEVPVDSVPSAEAFGLAELAQDKFLSVTGIASSEAVGTPELNMTLTLTGIVSGEALGSPAIGFNLLAVGIASEESFGSTQLFQERFISVTGIPSQEAFGSTFIQPEQFLNLTGIPSAEAFGETSMTRFYRPVAISSEEAFGLAVIQGNESFVECAGFGGEAFGDAQLNLTLTATPAETGEAMGDTTVEANYSIQAVGITPADAYGEPTLNLTLYSPSAVEGETFGSARMETRVVVPSVQDGETMGSVRLSTAQQLPILIYGTIL